MRQQDAVCFAMEQHQCQPQTTCLPLGAERSLLHTACLPMSPEIFKTLRDLLLSMLPTGCNIGVPTRLLGGFCSRSLGGTEPYAVMFIQLYQDCILMRLRVKHTVHHAPPTPPKCVIGAEATSGMFPPGAVPGSLRGRFRVIKTPFFGQCSNTIPPRKDNNL